MPSVLPNLPHAQPTRQTDRKKTKLCTLPCFHFITSYACHAIGQNTFSSKYVAVNRNQSHTSRYNIVAELKFCAAFRESIRCAEHNLYARAVQLVGDRDPRSHEFSVQLRAFDSAKSGAKTGVASLIALASALLRKSVRGGLVLVGEVTLGGTIEPVHTAVSLAELAIEKGAKSLLLPVSCRRQLFDLSDEMSTKLDVEFYQDGRDALLKALVD